jgi:hypothetical protein
VKRKRLAFPCVCLSLALARICSFSEMIERIFDLVVPMGHAQRETWNMEQLVCRVLVLLRSICPGGPRPCGGDDAMLKRKFKVR